MSDERREAHNEALRILIDNLTEKTASNTKRISDIEEEVWGYPKGKGEGLLQKVRDSNRKWTIAMAICLFIVSALGRLISPLYDKFVSDWVYNSPSEKWLREQQRPKIKRIQVHIDAPKESP